MSHQRLVYKKISKLGMSGSRETPYFPIFPPTPLTSLPYSKLSKEATIISSLWDKHGPSWPSTPKESRIKKKKFCLARWL